ncbi:MAG: hypothetical protein M5U28_38255 [Sandaracinaceae bacterium]|nr:hypothetical protein [Sandaracinaceae bacterium]
MGASYDDTSRGANAGSAYVFVRSGTTWTVQARLEASDGAAGDGFGRSVALDGDTALIGANLDDTSRGTNAGSAYVFVRSGTTWTQQARLEASDGAGSDYFGLSVALDGGTALVGAPYDDTSRGASAGSATVFVRSGTTWTQQAKLEATDGAAYDYFGWSVALDGDTALVGAPYDDTWGDTDAGSASVFVRSGTTWAWQARLEASDGAASDQFGWSVALDGDTALVGALYDDTWRGTNAGSAYVFVRSGATWTWQARLEASDGAASDYFGHSVALDGETALLGAYGDDTSRGTDAGSAYVFVRSGTTWTEQTKLEASDGAAGDVFGYSVALDGDTALVGAYGDDTSRGTDAGSAYVFVLRRADGDPCADGGQCASGFCTDGVCCATACGGGASDCRACSVAAGGTANGTCTPLSAAAAPTVVCRPSAGECDVAESCTAASTACPTDALASAGTECRASAGGCDLAESCTGSSAACPADALATAGTECRASAGECDLAEACTGSEAACPADALAAAGTECRAAAGGCDLAEACTGSEASCPSDALAAAGTECRAASCASGIETLAASCDGAGASCPAAATRECAPYACGERRVRRDLRERVGLRERAHVRSRRVRGGGRRRRRRTRRVGRRRGRARLRPRRRGRAGRRRRRLRLPCGDERLARAMAARARPRARGDPKPSSLARSTRPRDRSRSPAWIRCVGSISVETRPRRPARPRSCRRVGSPRGRAQ